MRRCLTEGCPHLAVAGRSRCSRHGPTSPARHGPNPYDYAHQRARTKFMGRDAVCSWCGRPGTPSDPLQLDHIIPLSMGGRSDPSNYQLLHRSENISKGGMNRVKR